MTDTYEVRVKDGEQTPIPPSEEQLSALIDARAKKEAETIAAAEVEKLKTDLATSLTGGNKSRYGETGPKSWDELHDNILTEAEQRAARVYEENMKKMEEKRKSEEEMTAKEREDAQKAEYAQISLEWQELVEDKVLPPINPEVLTKLQSGKTFAQLTPEEQQDPGLRAFNESRMFYAKQKAEGKTGSFYRTIQRQMKQPGGMSAPVIGGGAPTSHSSELEYEDVSTNRRKIFGF